MNWQEMNEDAVIVAQGSVASKLGMTTFKMAQLTKHVQAQWGDLQTKDGSPCEMLAPGGNWQKGRMRIVIQFAPEDQPEQIPFAPEQPQQNEF